MALLARNYWPRLFGASLAAALFAPDHTVWWIDMGLHLLATLAFMLLTSPEKPHD